MYTYSGGKTCAWLRAEVTAALAQSLCQHRQARPVPCFRLGSTSGPQSASQPASQPDSQPWPFQLDNLPLTPNSICAMCVSSHYFHQTAFISVHPNPPSNEHTRLSHAEQHRTLSGTCHIRQRHDHLSLKRLGLISTTDRADASYPAVPRNAGPFHGQDVTSTPCSSPCSMTVIAWRESLRILQSLILHLEFTISPAV